MMRPLFLLLALVPLSLLGQKVPTNVELHRQGQEPLGYAPVSRPSPLTPPILIASWQGLYWTMST